MPRKKDNRIEKALTLIYQYGGVDGAHHKQWVLDQIVRVLADDYDAWVDHYSNSVPNDYYEWEKGTPP